MGDGTHANQRKNSDCPYYCYVCNEIPLFNSFSLFFQLFHLNNAEYWKSALCQQPSLRAFEFWERKKNRALKIIHAFIHFPDWYQWQLAIIWLLCCRWNGPWNFFRFINKRDRIFHHISRSETESNKKKFKILCLFNGCGIIFVGGVNESRARNGVCVCCSRPHDINTIFYREK